MKTFLTLFFGFILFLTRRAMYCLAVKSRVSFLSKIE